MKDFYNIREFACIHFYKWEDGDDFDWLKKEWYKFEPHLKEIQEVEDFILTLADIYGSFCHEAYFENVPDDVKKYPLIIENPNPEPTQAPEITKRIQGNYDRTLDILIKVYDCPEEILRQFTAIFIRFQIPNQDGYKYIFDLFKDKWDPNKEIESGDFGACPY